MTKEVQPNGTHRRPARQAPIEHRIAALSSRLISIRDAAPGSVHHEQALRELMGVLASNEGAVDVLARQQGQAVQNDDRI